MAETHHNLLAGGKDTLLPEDPALAELTERGTEGFLDVVRAHPASSLCWALLAEASLRTRRPEADLAAYAYARTGYHRGLDALRRSGWRGEGPVPWDHVPNQGFLRCLWALSVAAGRIGESDEQERCAQFLRDSSEQAHTVLSQAQEQADREHADKLAELEALEKAARGSAEETSQAATDEGVEDEAARGGAGEGDVATATGAEGPGVAGEEDPQRQAGGERAAAQVATDTPGEHGGSRGEGDRTEQQPGD